MPNVRDTLFKEGQANMFFLILCKLFLWNMCWCNTVVDAQRGDQSLKREEYQLGIKRCEERCLDTGECLGFNYDSSALRCSLTFGEDNFQYKTTSKQCGTSLCKRGERCLTTRKSIYACAWYVTQENEKPKEKGNLSLAEIKLNLTYVGLLETDDYNFCGCAATCFLDSTNNMYLLNANKLIAISMSSADVVGTWPIEDSGKFKPIDLTHGWFNIANRQDQCFVMMMTSRDNDKIWLFSFTSTNLDTKKTIQLTNRHAVTPAMKSKHHHLHMYKNNLYLASRSTDTPYNLYISKFQSVGHDYKLELIFSTTNDLFKDTPTPFNFFNDDKYAFVLVTNVLFRWRAKGRKTLKIRKHTEKVYRWESSKDIIWLTQETKALYTMDLTHHLWKTEMVKLIKHLP